jgi:sugar lactone lactonase YvrE
MGEAGRRISRDAVLPIQQANALTGESPFWDPRTQTIWWIDVQGQRLLGFEPTGGAELEYNLPSMPGLVVGGRKGGLIVGLEDGFYEFERNAGLGVRLVAVEADDPRTRMNDGKPDATGRLWFGTMEKTGSGAPIGSLYRLGEDGSLRREREGLAVPNGITFAPGGRSFYFADTRARTIYRHAYDPTAGTIGAAEEFAVYRPGEAPDGSCADAEGALWVAVVGGSRVERRLPDGSIHTVIDLPVSRPTMPMLGGADGRTLFITSQRRFLTAAGLRSEPFAGDLLAVRVEVPAADVHLVA